MTYIREKQLIVLLIVTCLGTAVISVWSSVQSKNVDRVVIENRTRSFAVESIKPLTDVGEMSRFEITFRNNYDKPISVYRFRVSDDSSEKDAIKAIERNGLVDNWLLKPHETSTSEFSAGQSGKIIIAVSAVLFEDGTGDGGPIDLTILQENRAGVWMALNKIIPIIKENLMTDPSSPIESKAGSMEEKVRQLSDDDVPNNSKRGFAFAKNNVTMTLKDLKENTRAKSGVAPASKLTGKLDQLETISAKLSVNLPAGLSKGGRQQ
jgi:hypothetical protein